MRLLLSTLLLLSTILAPNRVPQVPAVSPSTLGLLLPTSRDRITWVPRVSTPSSSTLGLVLQPALTHEPADRIPPDRHRFLYSRVLTIPAGEGPRACAVLDAATFIHAQPALADLRLFSGSTEIPYVLTLSETRPTTDPATILNRGLRGSHIVFDLKMPPRPYTHVDLDLDGRDFLVTARVTGLSAEHSAPTSLGTFTLFDLSAQVLGRSTTLPLPESNFPFLHVDLQFLDPGHPIALISPVMIRAASVPPSREAQTLYTPIAESSTLGRRGSETVATFQVPAHVPVERASFAIGGEGPLNFSRTVTVRAKAIGDANAMREEVSGEISRVKLIEHGHQINFESLAVPAIVGSNGQASAEVEVAVENGDDPPLAIHAARLDMRERKLCFDVPEGPVDLFYGDPALQPPFYDYARLFNPATSARPAQLHIELPNPLYEPPLIKRPSLLERHPVLLWIALLAVASILGTIAWASSRRV